MLVISSINQVHTPTAIALGNFDGIHLGHQKVLQPIINLPENRQHLISSVVSFRPHPREFFSGGELQLLTPVEEKAKIINHLGIQQLILLHFDRKLATLSPEEFVEQILVQKLQAQVISVGADFCFGKQRAGTAQDLYQIASKFGVEVHLTSLRQHQDHEGQAVRVSSSLVRKALLAGEIASANSMLGRPYRLQGQVVTGQKIGRTIGFPTANLELSPEKFLPRFGVYSVQAKLPEGNVSGVMNIGCRPTVSGSAPSIEVHLLNWSGDLYGRTLTVELQRFLRPEQKFPSLEALKQQISQDCKSALNNFSTSIEYD